MAMRFSENFINELVERNDLADVISGYTNLKRAGSTMKGLCPFHNEKTPSFSVSPDKQLYYCFGCQKGGNVIHFIMDIEHLDFVEAVKFLAERVGMEIPEEDLNASAQAGKRQVIYAINRLAALFFMESLDEQSWQYLNKRALTPQTVKRFGIGYAPDGNKLLAHLREKGYTDNDIIDAGLAIRNDQGRVYDRFRNRLIFPIIDLRKNVIGFGGRVFDDSVPKYLNSPETEAFSKSRNLFGLNFAKATSENYLILVEGYMDVIALHQAGITNAVATLGTALTPEQARIIKRLKPEVVIAYDSDQAGRNATNRAIEIFGSEGIRVRVLVQDAGKDPDEYIRENGAGAFLKLIEQAPLQVDYQLRLLAKEYSLDTPDGKLKYISAAALVFAGMSSQVEREIYIHRLAEETKVSASAILSEVNRIIDGYRKKERLQQEKQSGTASPAMTARRENYRLQESEKILLNLMFYYPTVTRYVRQQISADVLTVPLHQEIYKKILLLYDSGQTPQATAFINGFDGHVSEVAEILQDSRNIDDKEQAVRQTLQTIQKEYQKRRISNALQNNAEELEKINELYKGRKDNN